MDMKKILQAFDGAADKKPAEGVNDMKKFLSVITEGAKVDRMVAHIKASEKEAGKSDKEAEQIAWATVNKRGYLDNKNKKNEAVITGFEEGSIGGDANDFLLAADKINDEVMAQVNKIKINADEASLRDMMDKFNAFMTAYHNVGKGILQPDMFNNSMGEGVAEGSGSKEKQKTPYRDINSPEYRAAADKQKQQMAKDKAAEPGKKLADKIAKKGVAEMDKSQPSHGRDGKVSHSTYGSRDKGGSTGQERTAKMTTADKMMKDAHKTMMKSMSQADKVKKGWAHPSTLKKESLSFKDYASLIEAKNKIKGADGKACWDGYKYAGTENGKDKCVKIKKASK